MLKKENIIYFYWQCGLSCHLNTTCQVFLVFSEKVEYLKEICEQESSCQQLKIELDGFNLFHVVPEDANIIHNHTKNIVSSQMRFLKMRPLTLISVNNPSVLLAGRRGSECWRKAMSNIILQKRSSLTPVVETDLSDQGTQGLLIWTCKC